METLRCCLDSSEIQLIMWCKQAYSHKMPGEKYNLDMVA